LRYSARSIPIKRYQRSNCFHFSYSEPPDDFRRRDQPPPCRSPCSRSNTHFCPVLGQVYNTVQPPSAVPLRVKCDTAYSSASGPISSSISLHRQRVDVGVRFITEVYSHSSIGRASDRKSAAGNATVSHLTLRRRMWLRYSAKSIPNNQYHLSRCSNIPGSGVSGGSIQ